MILVLNCGSQSIKYKIFNGDFRVLKEKAVIIKHQRDYHQSLVKILNELKSFDGLIKVVGHRVVHGGQKFRNPILITPPVLKELSRYDKLAPLHNPFNLLGIKASLKIFQKTKQIAVFDTGFYKDLPEHAMLYPLPESIRKKYGFQRFGFHGISHKYAAELAGGKRVISCHLGGGSSITAVENGKAIDTSMGFTPMEGLTMMSRSGDLDPGIVLELARTLSPEKASEILNHESGLKGICGLSDMKEILKKAGEGDKKANLALRIFVYRIQKYIGAYYVVLGGCDTLVFTGAIGAGSLKIRQMICGGLAILNKPNKIKILAVKTSEELAIAKEAKNMKSKKYILWFNDINSKDVPLVGGKNASLGEMLSRLTQKGISVPDGFALTTAVYWRYLKANKIDGKLKTIFQDFNPQKIESLQKVGKASRALILRGVIPPDLKEEIIKAYQELGQKYGPNPTVAVRTSGVAEDTASASFAGQFETYLNVCGEQNLLEAVKKSIASTFTDRAIAYREEKGFSQLKLGLSVGVQKMIRSDLGSAGIIFTLDTESGFKDVVIVNSIFGIGEMIVKGKITPDQFTVFKPTLEQGFRPIIAKNLGRKTKKYVFAKTGGLKEVSLSKSEQIRFSLTDDEVLKLAQWANIIEKHYGRPQDIEWAKDGQTQELFIVQSRPETVHAAQDRKFYEEYELKTKKDPIVTGIAVGNKIGQGKIRVIESIAKINKFQKGEILVTKMTDPDWLPIMRVASAIVTDEGSRVCHAAIVSRELGIPAIVGTNKATKVLATGKMATVDCSSGTGRVFLNIIPFEIKKYNLKNIPETKTKIMMNIGSPEIAFKNSFLPNQGVGLAREEFIIASKINAHPLALIKQKKTQFFVDELACGIGQIGAAFWPNPVIVRFSDFKTNEYATLPGGQEFEPKESNPMIGWRGASRYYDPKFKKAFILECQALKKAREIFGLKNIWAMVPFCRTIKEGKKTLAIMKESGLAKGKDGLKVIVMCEIPSNVVLAKEFLEIFDGMSIGSNDLTQLVLGLDRDNALIANIGNEKNEAVKKMISSVIQECKKQNKYCGICGQAPSDFPDFAEFLVEQGIESISLNPDTVIKTLITIARKEKKLLKLRQSENGSRTAR